MLQLRCVVVAGLFMAAAAGVSAGESFIRELPYVPGQVYPDGARAGEEWCLYQYPPEMEWIDKVIREQMTIKEPVDARYGSRTDTYECEPEYSVGQATAIQWQSGSKGYTYRKAYDELRVIPARFEERSLEVEVCPEYTEEYWENAQFDTKTETFVICPERKQLRTIPCHDGSGTLCYAFDILPEKRESVTIKTLRQDGQVRTRTVPAKYATIVVSELVEEARTERMPQPAIERAYNISAPVQGTGRVQITRIPAKRFSVTSMVLEQEATTIDKTLPPIVEKVQIVKAPGRTVWRLQQAGFRQPLSQAIQSDQNIDDYGSAPGSIAPRHPRFTR